MIIDNIIVNSLKKEFKENILDFRIDKIYQIDNYHILITTWNKKSQNIIISLNPNTYRACLTDKDYIITKQNTPFINQLKRNLEGAFITNVEQINFDRIIKFELEGITSIKDKVIFYLILELTGKYSNLIFTDKNEVILGAYKYIDDTRNQERQILLEKKYVPITNKTNKLEIASFNKNEFTYILNEYKNEKLKRTLINCFAGLSSNTVKLLFGDAFINKQNKDFDNKEIDVIFERLNKFYSDFKKDSFNIHFSDNLDFYFSDLPSEQSASYCLENYYFNLVNKQKFSDLKSEVFGVVNKNLAKVSQKIKEGSEKYSNSQNCDFYRHYSDLLFSNLYNLPNKISKVTLENYYDNNNIIEIDLDDTLTITENAQIFLKKYNKQKNTIKALESVLADLNVELNYLENVATFIENAEDIIDLKEIKEELIDQKYISEKKSETKHRKNKAEKPNFLKFISSDGLEILVGKNNTQNDILTTKVASPHDIWLHTRLIPGSHVIIKTDNGQKKIPDSTLLEAGKISAKYSKAKSSSNVCVIYTKIKNVKKPAHSKPGFVLYSNEKSIYVTPDN